MSINIAKLAQNMRQLEKNIAQNMGDGWDCTIRHHKYGSDACQSCEVLDITLVSDCKSAYIGLNKDGRIHFARPCQIHVHQHVRQAVSAAIAEMESA